MVVGVVVGFVVTDVVTVETEEFVDFVEIMFSVEFVSCAAVLSILFPHAHRDKHSVNMRMRANVFFITIPPKTDYLIVEMLVFVVYNLLPHQALAGKVDRTFGHPGDPCKALATAVSNAAGRIISNGTGNADMVL